MTEEYIPREGDPLPVEELMPGSPREERIYRAIRNIVAQYMVKGDSKDLDAVALEIWRVTRR